jgi:hypothetical protein
LNLVLEQQKALRLERKPQKPQKKQNKGVQERALKDAQAMNPEKNSSEIMAAKAELYNKLKDQKDFISNKTQKKFLVDFNSEKMKAQFGDEEEFEAEKKRFYADLAAQNKKKVCTDNDSKFQETEKNRLKWEEAVLREMEQGISTEEYGSLAKRAFVAQSYDKTLSGGEKKMLQEVLSQEDQEKRDREAAKKKKEEVERIKKEKLKKLNGLKKD